MSKKDRAESKARRRAAKLGTHDLVMWVDNTMYEIGRDSRRGQDGIDRALANTEILWDLLSELRSRR